MKDSITNKNMNGINSSPKGGTSGAPTSGKYFLQGMGPDDALLPYRHYLTFGAGLSYINGGSGGTDILDTVGYGTVTSISAVDSSIILTPDPIVATGTVGIGKSIWTGSKASTPVAKQGIIDVPTVSPSTYTGLAATNNSALSMGGNDFSGVASGVVVAGGDQTGNAGDRNSINNIINCVIAGITHILSGGLANSIISGYNNVVTGGGNHIVGGQTNTIVSSGAVLGCGISCSATSTQTALLCGENNGITGGRNNSILSGKINSITTGAQCCISGYNNGITGGNDTLISGYACSFVGGVSNDVNQLIGYGISLIGGLNHRGNLWLVGGFGGASGRAATTYVGSMLMAIGFPTAASPFDNGGVVAPPIGYDSNNTLALYGDRIVMDCNNGGEMRCIGVNNIRSVTAPATGDDYCNKTYVDGIVISGRTSTSQDYYLYDDSAGFTIVVNPGPTDSVFFGTVSGAPANEYEFDPIAQMDNATNVFGRCNFNAITPTTRKVKIEFKSGMRSLVAGDPCQYYIKAKYNGAYVGELLRINANHMDNDTPIDVSGFLIFQADFSAATPRIELFLDVANGIGGPETISFDNPAVTYTILAQ